MHDSQHTYDICFCNVITKMIFKEIATTFDKCELARKGSIHYLHQLYLYNVGIQ